MLSNPTRRVVPRTDYERYFDLFSLWRLFLPNVSHSEDDPTTVHRIDIRHAPNMPNRPGPDIDEVIREPRLFDRTPQTSVNWLPPRPWINRNRPNGLPIMIRVTNQIRWNWIILITIGNCITLAFQIIICRVVVNT